MIKIAICDDDKMCLDNIAGAVARWSTDNNIQIKTEFFDNGDSLLDYCSRENPDIVLLDIIMPLLNGMDTARELRQSSDTAKIVFLTSSPEFAIESYDVKASGYILKLFSYEKLCSVLNDCTDSIVSKSDSLTVRTSSGYHNIYMHRIECIEAQNKQLIITLADGTECRAHGTLSSLEKILTCDMGFFKCHRSYIVRIQAVDYFTSSEIVTKSGRHIPVARSMGKNFKAFYFSHMFKEV